MLTALEQRSGARLAVWHGDGRRVPAGAGAPDGDDWVPPLEGRTAGHSIATPHGPAWFEPVPDIEGVWLEIGASGAGPRAPDTLAAIVGAALGAERDAAQVAAELSERYEEIDLIYTISEILGQTIRLDEAADRILREVAGVVRARRATLLVHDRERKLVAAIANQIGAAIENATLVAKDLSQQRVRRELELAHDLQLKLLPSPLVIAARVDVAARCRQAESVGGDFYNLLNLPDDRIGVIIGDVTSHGFGAALIMALVMAASGIHAQPGAGVVCLFTDGLAEAEAEGERGGRFGEERVLGHVARLTDRPARDMLEAIYADLAGFTGGAPAADDRTLVILKV